MPGVTSRASNQDCQISLDRVAHQLALQNDDKGCVTAGGWTAQLEVTCRVGLERCHGRGRGTWHTKLTLGCGRSELETFSGPASWNSPSSQIRTTTQNQARGNKRECGTKLHVLNTQSSSGRVTLFGAA